MKCILNETEVKRMFKSFGHPHFTNNKSYAFTATVDEEWAKSVLPPRLEFTEPVVTVLIQKGDQFTGLVVCLKCRFEDRDGLYGLTYMMDTDYAVIFGREGLAEPKKVAQMTLEDDGKKVVFSAVRLGTELMHMEAEITGPGPEGLGTGSSDFFHYKYSIKPDGSGLEPIHLVDSHFDSVGTDSYLMKVTKLELNESKMDIYGDIPITGVLPGAIYTLDSHGSAWYLCDVDEEEFLPHAFRKYDDYTLLMDSAD